MTLLPALSATPPVMDVALEYAAHGLRVVPLRPDKAGSLLPGRVWKKRASTVERDILGWEREWLQPGALIGVVVPDGKIVADVDYPDRLNGHRFPDGGAVRIGGRGYQYWLSDDGSRGGKLPAEAGEIKRSGTLVIVPTPGRKYSWGNDTRPWDDQPAAPDWIGAEVRKPYDPAADAADLFLNEAGYTSHDKILEVGGRWRWAGLTGADIEVALLRALADGRIVDGDLGDPWTEKHLRAIAGDLGAMASAESRGVTLLLGNERTEPRPDAMIGTRTAADLHHGPPPDQLGDPYLTAEGATCLYGRGGVGKGVTACWLVMRLVRSGHVVMVIDFEGHEREFGSRLRGLGMTDDELSMVHYRAPFGADWTAPTGPLSKIAAAIRDDCERLAVTYLVVDSYSVATSNGDTMGGEAAAREYFTALTTIGLPSLTIAHVKGDSGKFPDRPFGSVFVHNLARETWAVERLGDDDAEDDPDLIRFGPHVVALELRNRKSNGRAKAPAQFVTFSFYDDGTIDATTDAPGGRSVADLASDVLADGPLTVAKIVSAIKEDTGQVVTPDALRVTLKRHPDRFAESPSGRPRTWDARR